MRLRIATTTAFLLCSAFLSLFTSCGRSPSGAPGMQKSPGQNAKAELMVYCAAGLRSAVESVAREYEKEEGVRIALDFGGSGQLLSNIEITRTGDLFIAADASYIKEATEKKLVGQTFVVAEQKPVIAVAAGNPKHIAELPDLANPAVRVALANPESASIGRVGRTILSHMNLWAQISANATVMKPTVTDVANDVKIGAVDAAIVWDATVAQMPGLSAVHPEGFKNITEQITAGTLTCSAHPEESLAFARYLTLPEKGGKAFERLGFHMPARLDQ